MPRERSAQGAAAEKGVRGVFRLVPKRGEARYRAARKAAGEAEATRRQQAVIVRQYAERWLAVHVAHECRERTARQCRSVLEQHVYPVLGDVPVTDLTRLRIKTFLAGKAEAGLKRGTLKNIIVFLRALLNEAVDEGLITGSGPPPRPAEFPGSGGSARRPRPLGVGFPRPER